MDAFTDELDRAETLGLACVVIHPGSHLGAGVEAGLARVTAALDEVTRRTPGYRVKIALENTAGAGNAVGRTFAQLGALLARAGRPERIGACVDACHLVAAGYAKAPLDSGLDRHENIGKGRLGHRHQEPRGPARAPGSGASPLAESARVPMDR